MSRLAKFGLKGKLFLMLVALVLLPLALLSTLAYSLSASSVEKNTAYTLTSAASGKMTEMDYFYGNITDILTTTAGSVDMLDFFTYQESGGTSGLYTQSLSALSSKFDYVLLLYNNYLDSIAVVPNDRLYYQIVRRAPSSKYYDSMFFSCSGNEIAPPVVNELGIEWRFTQDPSSGKLIGTAHTSIFSASKNAFLGTLSCIINMDYIDKNVNSLASDGNVVILTEAGGAPISSSVSMEAAEAFLSSVAGAEGAGKGKPVHVGSRRYLWVDAVSPSTGWRMYLFAPYEIFMGGLRTIPLVIIAASIVYLVYSLLLARYIFRVIYKPIKRLTDDMNNVTYESITVQNEPRATDELKELEVGFNKMKRDITGLIENVRVEQEQKKEMEIRALQAQIMPHFLYNTLNSIKSLINMGQAKEASEMIVAFINLLRISVDTAEECIYLYEEISYLRHYILIMNHRYHQSIQLQIDMDETLIRCKIPKFILQPVVENSIIHGYERWQKGYNAVIQVVIRQEGEDIFITVSDNGCGIAPEKLEKLKQGIRAESRPNHFSHIGIGNIADRIRLLYGEDYGICVESNVDEGTKVTVKIPKRL